MTETMFTQLAKDFRERAQAAAVMAGSIPDMPVGLFARPDPDRVRRLAEYGAEARTWKEAADLIDRVLAGERMQPAGGAGHVIP
jgi:hypothetical protein